LRRSGGVGKMAPFLRAGFMSDGSKPSFIPLADAALTVYKETTGQSATDPALLDLVAASIAKHARIYAREGWGDSIELVRPDVLEHAAFQDGGTFMRSRNVSYVGLCIRQSDLPALIQKLSGAFTPRT